MTFTMTHDILVAVKVYHKIVTHSQLYAGLSLTANLALSLTAVLSSLQ